MRILQIKNCGMHSRSITLRLKPEQVKMEDGYEVIMLTPYQKKKFMCPEESCCQCKPLERYSDGYIAKPNVYSMKEDANVILTGGVN